MLGQTDRWARVSGRRVKQNIKTLIEKINFHFSWGIQGIHPHFAGIPFQFQFQWSWSRWDADGVGCVCIKKEKTHSMPISPFSHLSSPARIESVEMEGTVTRNSVPIKSSKGTIYCIMRCIRLGHVQPNYFQLFRVKVYEFPFISLLNMKFVLIKWSRRREKKRFTDLHSI